MGGRCAMTGGGWLTTSDVGGRIRLEAVRPLDGKGLYKVWISGGGGGRMLLGTMMPCGERLELCRTFTRTSLQSAGCYPVTGAEAVMAFAFGKTPHKKAPSLPDGWTVTEHVQIEEPFLRGCVQACTGLLTQPRAYGFRLAVPYSEKQEFPMTALFCFAQLEKLCGRDYLVWDFDENGRPIMADNCTKNGEDSIEAHGD